MAIEAKRGCGFRTVGGLYLVCDGVSFPCDRLTFEIPEICPCCGGGTKFSRGWTWIDPVKFFDGDHYLAKYESAGSVAEGPDVVVDIEGAIYCDCCAGHCSVCRPAKMGDRAALLWIGEKHYSPDEFKEEAAKLGVSKKIPAVPRDLVLGKTWVLCAHKKAIGREVSHGEGELYETEYSAGVFFAFVPTRLERIVKQSDLDLFQRVEAMPEDEREAWLDGKLAGSLMDRLNQAVFSRVSRNEEIKAYKKMAQDAKRGITFVPVPDDDPEHNPEGK